MKYKIGDKVRVRRDLVLGKVYGLFFVNETMYSRRGDVAEIANVFGEKYHITGLGGGYGWTDEMLEPIHDEKIVITTDGVTTTAKKYDGKNLIKEAKAVCSRDDTFNFDVGAKLAMERLLEEKPKLYNGKVVCIEASHRTGFTKGKIYRFTEGFTLDDNNEVRPATRIPIESFEDLEREYPARWLEVVE